MFPPLVPAQSNLSETLRVELGHDERQLVAGDELEGTGPGVGAGHQHRQLRDVPLGVGARGVHQVNLVPSL